MIIFSSKRKRNSKKSYFDTRDAAWQFLIDNNVRSYPLDLQRVVNQNGWKVLNKRSYILRHPTLRKYAKRSEGLTIELNGSYIILIDAEGSSVQRNRFTIAHEIGHIYLQHVGTKNVTIEKEANMFASRILMPMLLIKELDLKTAEELSKLCNVSLQAATYRIKRYSQIKDREKFYTSPLERQVHEQLKQFIEQQKEKK